jgi:IclR family mhp operon transcriptional activator
VVHSVLQVSELVAEHSNSKLLNLGQTGIVSLSETFLGFLLMLGTNSVKSVDALRRGLLVMHAIKQSSAVTLAELHLQTGIPKASLLRILKTLIESGWVVRNELERRFMPAASPGDSGPHSHWRSRLSALAAPVRTSLERRIPWPTDLAVRDGTSMLILDAHRPINGIAVNYRVLGFRPSMLVSSLGRCYLTFCPDEERRSLLALLARTSAIAQNRNLLREDAIQRLIATGRTQGYCSRDPSELGSESPERFGAIAVPVFAGDELLGSLSCAWLPKVTDKSIIVTQCLGALRDAAQLIGERAQIAHVRPPERALSTHCHF